MEEKEIARRGRKKKEIDKTFSERLSKLLKDKKEQGLIQDDVAKAIGVSRQALGKWANGETVPDIMDLKSLASYFEVSSDFLLGLSEFTNGDNSFKDVSKRTNIPERTLYNITKLYNLGTEFPDIEVASMHKYHTFFFFERDDIDKIINGYINSIYESFENAYSRLLKEEASDNGNNNPTEE